jgi:hypothetical protein
MTASVVLLVAAMLTGFSTAAERRPQRAPRYISLLIGVGDYKYAREWEERKLNLKTLHGPRTNVVRMQHALRRWGFQDGRANQRVLVDSQASKAGIDRALRWVASQATDSADVVVIYYSGHGSWAPDSSIDAVRTIDEALSDPGDRFDEGLVPWDARHPHDPRHLVLDDEIGTWLSRLGSQNVTVIVDACFSGTITRGDPDTTSAGAPIALGPQAPPHAKSARSDGFLEGGRRMNHTLLTAAEAWELAYEQAFFPGAVISGVFTRFLAEALDGADRSTRFDELIHQVGTKVGRRQTPTAQGHRTAPIFRVGAGIVVPARGYSLVRAAGRGRVVLDAGGLHGVRKGALYDVYSPTETRFREGRLAQVRVDSVFEGSSFADILSGARDVPALARATLSRVPPGAMALNRLRVFLNPSARTLRDSLATIEWLELTDRAVIATAEVRLRNNAYQVLVGGHEIPPLRGDDALPVGPGSVRGYQRTARALCTPLRRAYSIAAMNLLRNDQPPPPSRLKLEVRVLPAGTVPTEASRTSIDSVYVGKPYEIWAWVQIPDAAVLRTTLYLNVGIAGYTQAPRVIWPDATGQTPLTRHQLNVPLLVGSMPGRPVPGIENIKGVVSSERYDMRSLRDQLPRCPVGPPDEIRGDGQDTLVVAGWTAIDRRVEIYAR